MTHVSDLEPTDVPPAGDTAMTRSEERLRVGVQTRAYSRAVLRKHVVTEEVTQTFTVRREEVRVEQVPITEGAGDGGWGTTPLDTGEVEVIVYEERPVVTMQLVPVERVRLRKEVVTERVQVTEQLRREQIDLDVDRAPEV